MRITPAGVFPCVLVVAALGCGKKDEAKPAAGPAGPTAPAPAPTTPTAPTATAAVDAGSCQITIDRPAPRSWTAPGGEAALMSDYFMNDAELRQALSYMVKSPADVDGAMRKDPRLYPLMVNCVADGVRLNFTAAPGTTYADLPFGPKAYAIGGDKGQIAVMGTADQALLTPAPGGTFEVTRFDAHGLVATFSFTTRGDGATVSGTLDLRCALRTEMCRAAR